jgi:hypothetical protein
VKTMDPVTVATIWHYIQRVCEAQKVGLRWPPCGVTSGGLCSLGIAEPVR